MFFFFFSNSITCFVTVFKNHYYLSIRSYYVNLSPIQTKSQSTHGKPNIYLILRLVFGEGQSKTVGVRHSGEAIHSSGNECLAEVNVTSVFLLLYVFVRTITF